MLARFVAASVAVCSLAWGQPQLTTIEDVLFKADGTRFNGIAQILWTSFEAGNTANIPAQSTTARIIDGNLFVQLTPTTNAVPTAWYTVKYNSDGRVQFQEIWAVPPATGKLRVRDVRTTLPQVPGAGGVAADTLIPESDVVGLTADLAARAVKGPGFTTSRAVFSNDLGELEAVAGALSNCVHVDGTSGACGSTVGFVDSQAPAGLLDGSNVVFTLPSAPNPASSLSLYRNGVFQKATFDYTLSGAIVTFISPAVPQPGDVLMAYYRVAGAGGASPVFVDAEVPSGAVDGTNATFLLSTTPAPAASVQLFRNGILMILNTDYSITGGTILFRPASTPRLGDMLTAYYRH